MKKIICLLSLLSLLVIFAGCSNGSSSSKKAEDPIIANIKKTKVLTVGTDATFPPFEYKNNGEYTGFDIDLVKAVAKKLGADKVKFVDTEFNGLVPGLQAKKFDMIVSAMYITPERQKAIDFSDSYYPGGLSILVNKNNTSINTLKDLEGKKIAVQVGTKSVDFLKENLKKPNLTQVDTNNAMFLELQTKKVDAVVTGLPAAKVYAKSHSSVKVLPETLTNENYGYGIRKDNKGLTKAVNKALKALKKDGEYSKIEKKWFE
ncbi:transporter substrate-binding domain-containing protein [Sporolactobacillus sp. STCC-11]|uniref:transporter substrate-binding domain-containing protein n=1 Tax=Sporolactobacillus caesalpiniae TaxID=3230362 RepID=UPI0033959F02